MKKFVPLLIFLAIVSCFGSVSAREYSAKSIAAFTRHLIGHKEYYRAFVELKRLRSIAPGHMSPLAFSVTENYLLFQGKQYKDIINGTAGPSAPLEAAAVSLFRYDAAVALRDYGKAEAVLAVWGSASEPFLDRCLKTRRLFLYLAARRYDEAAAFCEALPESDFSACRELIGLARQGFSREKKPWLAAVLGIIPGAGYMYSGQYATGVFAFLLISIDVIMTYFAFRTRNDVIGYFTGIIGGFFYAGSIAGGYFAAQRFNLEQGGSVGSSMAERLGFERDRDELYNRHGMGFK